MNIDDEVIEKVVGDDSWDDITDDEWEDVFCAVIHVMPTETIMKCFGMKDKKIKRTRRGKVDLWDSEWGRLLRHDNTMIPGTFEYKKFRLRFRVPFPLFKYRLIPAIQGAKIFNKKRKSYIPTEFKVMIALRIIGRDTDCDTASELSGVPKSTCRTILEQFCEGFVENFYGDFVFYPNGSERDKIMETFSKVGFPGAMGSMDVTHFRWLACPKGEYNFCKGKYPFPTLAVQALVDHNRRILFLSDLYDGRENDKNITANEDFTYDIMNGKFNRVKYKLYDTEGVARWCEGGYIIVDGGYQNISCFVDPLHDANGHKEVHWSEFLESVRKDVECTFGILKSRFRILRNGLQYDRVLSHQIVKTCGMLHNMLLAYDGLDNFQWNKTGDWEYENPDMEDEDIFFHSSEDMNDNELTLPDRGRFVEVVNDTTQVGHTFISSSRNDYNRIHSSLIHHFYHQWRYGQLEWPRRFHGNSKRMHPMTRIKNALAQHTYDSLYVKHTDLVLIDSAVDLGNGLFCSMLLPSVRNGIKISPYHYQNQNCCCPYY